MHSAALALVLLTAAAPAGAAPPQRVVLQFFGGTAFTADSDLHIEQPGQPDLDHHASWESRSFEQPIYWVLRARWQRERDAFEFQFMHHKLYLANPTPEIAHYEVTHGYNILSGNYVRTLGAFLGRVGAGVVMPKTDAEVRGVYGGTSAYRVRGGGLLAGVGREWWFGQHFQLGVGAQVIWSRTATDVPGGTAHHDNLGLHLLMGLGIRF